MTDPVPPAIEPDPLGLPSTLGVDLHEFFRNVDPVYGDARGRAPGPSEGPPSSAGPALPSADPMPDRWVTYPVWVCWVLFGHGLLAVAELGAIGFGTAILFILAGLLDSAAGTWALRACAFTLGAVAAVGAVILLTRSFRKKARACPW